MAGRRATVSTIPPGVPFADALAAGLLARHGGEAFGLARVTVLLPTRRATLALRDAFLRRSGAQALLLPRILPLGDVDLDELEAGDGFAEDAADATPAIAELRRRLLLARLIARWPGAGPFARADQATRLAGELARLIDEVQTERLSFDGLAALVPEDYAGHWKETLEFLRIVTEHWPPILAELGLIDPAQRRNAMLEALARRWRATPPADPVYAAGSTGSIPATADLLAEVAGLPAGEVVLPGLDRDADDATWQALGETHPQFGLRRLLARMEVDRDMVADWPVAGDIAAGHPARTAMLNEALRPAETTDAWRDAAQPPAGALAGFERIDCPGPREEALVIALRLREALDEPGATAALVTRDRTLARRVAAELGRWDIAVDDSAGRPLGDSAPGSFLRLTAALFAGRAGPLALLATLKHPLAAGGMTTVQFRARVRELELAVLRGPRPAEGLAGVATALLASGKASRKLGQWFDGVVAAGEDFAAAMAAAETDLGTLARAHLAFAEWLATTDAEPGAATLWSGDAGEAAAAFFTELVECADAMAPMAGRDYAAVIESLLEDRAVRPRFGRHPRLHIWGPLEARLQHADLLVLGGLNEASWPPEAPADPWLSRPMRARFGLPSPERRIGLAAHDFVQLASARRVVLTRAEKVAGTPTVPSRWLARLEALLGGWGIDPRSDEGRLRIAWQEALDRPEHVEPGMAPAPRPPIKARPRRLSVTRIETWMRDPYAIYAERILDLGKLDPIDADPGAADRGTIIHKALEVFVRKYPDALPDDAYERLIEAGKACFADVMTNPGVAAFWWPRFERIARWFIETERARRGAVASVASEVRGTLEVPGPEGVFTLSATADRIERDRDGGLAVIDYKTGSVPAKKDIAAGVSPQLPLEAAIAAAGGFEGVAAAPVGALAFWRLTGGEPAGEEKPVKGDAMALAHDALAGLERLVTEFDDAGTPYHAVPDPARTPRFNDYAHLARIAEWADVDGGDGGDG